MYQLDEILPKDEAPFAVLELSSPEEYVDDAGGVHRYYITPAECDESTFVEGDGD